MASLWCFCLKKECKYGYETNVQLHIDFRSVSCFVQNMALRRSFTIKEKVDIISRLKNGENNATLCKEFKVPHSTISTMWRNRDVILECFATKSSKIKRNRNPTHQDVENALLKWFKDQENQKIMISGRVLQEKANHFAKMLGKVDFECSEGWIYRFRHRHDISVGKVCGDNRVSRNDSDSRLKSEKLEDSFNKTARLEEMSVSELKTDSGCEQLINQAHKDNMNQEALNIKTVLYCCFCGEVKNNFLYVIDKPYVESKKTTLTLNELSIKLDFNKDSTNKTVCQNCDTKLLEIHDFLKLVKNAQDKLKLVTLDIQNEGVLNNNSEFNNANIDDNNTAHEELEDIKKGYILDTEIVKETNTTHKRKNNEETSSNLMKKRKFSFELDSYSLLSLHDDNDGSEMVINEIKYEVDKNYERDPLVGADEEIVKAFSADRIHDSRECTKNVAHEDNVTIVIKEEIVEINDESDKQVQKEDEETKVIPFGIQDTRDSASNVCQEAVKLGTLANHMNATNKIGGRSDVLNALTSESETVGGMPKSELVLLVQSIVSQMLNKC